MTPATAKACPNCGDELHGLGTFCWTCECPVAVAQERAKKKTQPLPDDRLEKEIQRGITRVAELHGWTVADMSQSRPTQQLEGFSDQVWFHPAGVIAFIEVKRADGVQSPRQLEFERTVLRAGGIYRVLRSEDEAIAFCREVL